MIFIRTADLATKINTEIQQFGQIIYYNLFANKTTLNWDLQYTSESGDTILSAIKNDSYYAPCTFQSVYKFTRNSQNNTAVPKCYIMAISQDQIFCFFLDSEVKLQSASYPNYTWNQEAVIKALIQ